MRILVFGQDVAEPVFNNMFHASIRLQVLQPSICSALTELRK